MRMRKFFAPMYGHQETVVIESLDQEPRFPTSTRIMRQAGAQSVWRQQILAALEQAKWIIAGPHGAAAHLGMKRSALQSRMQKLGIRISRTAA